MNKNMITKAIAGSVMVAASMSAVAKVGTYSVGFVTVQDLVITEVSPISFGQQIVGKAGTQCTIAIGTIAAHTAAATTESTNGITGDGCLTVTAATTETFVGVYSIQGQAGQAVNVTVASVSGTDFDFSPSGELIATDSVDTGVSVFADSAATTTPDSANDTVALYLGGTLTIGAADLTANTPYSADYTITATY